MEMMAVEVESAVLETISPPQSPLAQVGAAVEPHVTEPMQEMVDSMVPEVGAEDEIVVRAHPELRVL
ncbi:hypothetical protein D3C72_2514250 [compost metagenome]